MPRVLKASDRLISGSWSEGKDLGVAAALLAVLTPKHDQRDVKNAQLHTEVDTNGVGKGNGTGARSG